MGSNGAGRSGIWLLGGLLVLAALSQACTDQSGSKGPTFPATQTGEADTSSQIKVQVAVNPNQIELGRRAGITVLVTNTNGRPLEGRRVQVSTSHGRLDTVDGVTGADGKFVTFLFAPCGSVTAGTAVTVTAFVESATSGTATVNVIVGSTCGAYGSLLFSPLRPVYALLSLALAIGLVAGWGGCGRRRDP